jgi:hypothetical protein
VESSINPLFLWGWTMSAQTVLMQPIAKLLVVNKVIVAEKELLCNLILKF